MFHQLKLFLQLLHNMLRVTFSLEKKKMTSLNPENFGLQFIFNESAKSLLSLRQKNPRIQKNFEIFRITLLNIDTVSSIFNVLISKPRYTLTLRKY